MVYSLLLLICIVIVSCTQKGILLTSPSVSQDPSVALMAVYVQTIEAAANPATGAGTAGSCVTCHTSTGLENQFPWADPNPQTAFNCGILELGLIDTSAPANSLILSYLSNGHCGGVECQVTVGSSVYEAFLTAVQNFVAAATPGAGVLPTAPAVTTAAFSLPENPPLLGGTPTLVNVPLGGANASVGTSFVQLSVAYAVTGVNGAGAAGFLYDISNPVLVNATTNVSITLAGFSIVDNGEVVSTLFANPRAYGATAGPGTAQSLSPSSSTVDATSFFATPTDSITLVVQILNTEAN